MYTSQQDNRAQTNTSYQNAALNISNVRSSNLSSDLKSPD